jgi:hypothetical protein
MSNDIDVMEHADGEQTLELDGDARAKADVVRELGELVRGRLERAADDVPDKRFAAMWREVDKGIDRALSEAPVRAGNASGASLWRRIGRFFDQYRGHIITGAVAAGAVAALALVLRPSGEGVKNGERDPINVQRVAHRPVDIEDLDTPGGTGTVFNLDDEDGTTTVIWVTPEDTVEGI